MKITYNIIYSTLTYTTAMAQDTSDETSEQSEQYFAMIYTTGENWDTEKQYHEQAYFTEHSAFLSGLRKEGRITLGGRYSDKGFMILKAKDEAEALALIATDESVANKTFNAEIFPFSVFYKGCVE